MGQKRQIDMNVLSVLCRHGGAFETFNSWRLEDGRMWLVPPEVELEIYFAAERKIRRGIMNVLRQPPGFAPPDEDSQII